VVVQVVDFHRLTLQVVVVLVVFDMTQQIQWMLEHTLWWLVLVVLVFLTLKVVLVVTHRLMVFPVLVEVGVVEQVQEEMVETEAQVVVQVVARRVQEQQEKETMVVQQTMVVVVDRVVLVEVV
jgi:hypothetical protein